MPLAGPTVTGAPGTYNYLIDAILSVPRTRAMYVRRLRSLMDQFFATGRLEVGAAWVPLAGRPWRGCRMGVGSLYSSLAARYTCMPGYLAHN